MFTIIMIEYYILEERNLSVVDTIIPETPNNPETRDNKNTKNNLPLYGIISLMTGLIGVLLVSLNFTSLNISFATPILLISVITAGEGINVDILRGTSIIGLILGIVYLLISLWPVILYVADLFVF